MTARQRLPTGPRRAGSSPRMTRRIFLRWYRRPASFMSTGRWALGTRWTVTAGSATSTGANTSVSGVGSRAHSGPGRGSSPRSIPGVVTEANSLWPMCGRASGTRREMQRVCLRVSRK